MTQIEPFSDAKIIESWASNASAWTKAVRRRQIDSRRQVTDRAIVEAIHSRTPGSVVDLGCGEGWLARELAKDNIRVIGIDAVPALVDSAQRAGGGDFHLMSYEEVVSGRLGVSADLVVCNFSLLGKESVAALFATVASLLCAQGSFIVQTLHPIAACGDLPYRDGWREGSWAGFSADFSDPAPWYFRTLESWIKLFRDNGFQLLEMRESLHPATQKPISVIFVAQTERNSAES